MSDLEIIIRTVAATAASFLAVANAQARPAPFLGRLFGALFCFGIASYSGCSATNSICATERGIPLLLLASAIPYFFWGWTCSIMNDDFRLTPLPIVAGLGLLAAPAFAIPLAHPQWTSLSVALHSVLGIGFVFMALFHVVRGWRQDLIEARRRLRLVVFGIAGTYSVIVMMVELILRNSPIANALQLLNASMLAIVLVGLSTTLLSLSDSLKTAFGWTASSKNRDSQSVESAPVETRDLEAELIERLRDKMSRQALYRDASLSVSTLAQSVGVIEKRLREIIHERLGYKNFSSFVNAYRLEEVRCRLEDPRNDDLPILTIALDAGFGSVVVFNRVFKDKLGITPSQYREKRATVTAQA